MLNRYVRVLFAVLGLLLFDLDNPSPDSTLILDTFDGVADLVEMLDTDSANESRSKTSPGARTAAIHVV